MSTIEGSSNVVKDKLLLYIDASNTKSYDNTSSIVNNLVYSESGTLDNGVGFTSSSPQYFTFDGTNDKISLGSRISTSGLTYPFSIDVWINVDPTGNTSISRGIFSTSNTPTSIAYYGIFIQLGSSYNGTGNYKVLLSIGTGIGLGTTSRKSITTNDEVLIGGQWCNLVGTVDSGPSFKIYVNGVEKVGVVSGSGVSLSWGSGTTTEIGPSNGYNQYFNGKIANLKFYNKLLSQSDVLDNYNSTKSKFGL